MDGELTPVLRTAIALAKRRGGLEVEPDDLLTACLLAVSRFGVARLGGISIDLEALGIDWLKAPAPGERREGPKAAYSEAVVGLLDRAAAIRKVDGRPGPVLLVHLLVAFATLKPAGLMAALARQGVDSAALRTALAAAEREPVGPRAAGEASVTAYLSPEQAAELLGVHHQTIRGYIRSGKLPALRIAGERAVRIRRDNLDRLLEPLPVSESESGE